ncbi:hypothetical protein [Halopiger goleimassiliensis]|uniref:hypothetical protein n=1 Tax=Halopiger goleimassiliensis TaxID=1293048 RepID=UPI000677F5D1|nr:hypothetical protein [Halopiger goleimassiliensis]
MKQYTSRREFIRTGGCCLTALGTVGLAGCASSFPGTGGDDDDGIDPWLVDPEPSAFVREGYEIEAHEFRERRFRYQEPSVVLEYDDHLSSDELWGRLVRDAFNVPAMEVDWQLYQHVDWWLDLYNVDNGADVDETLQPEIHVLAGSFDPEEIATYLEDDSNGDVVSVGSVHGFDRYELGSFRFAVRDDYLVQTRGDVWIDPDAVLEYVLDARWGEDGDGSGNTRRWTDDDRAGALLAERGSGQFVRGTVFPPVDPVEEPAYDWEWQTDLVGTSRALEVDGATTDVVDAVCYDSEADAEREAFRDFVDANRDVDDEAFPTLEEYDVERSEEFPAVLVLEGTARTGSIVGSRGPEREF